MRLDEIEKQSVYVAVSKEAIPGQNGYGTFRVRSLERTEHGWDVGINSWGPGVFTIPVEGKYGVVFRLKDGMPISTERAAKLL